jgi:hypothetical protein
MLLEVLTDVADLRIIKRHDPEAGIADLELELLGLVEVFFHAVAAEDGNREAASVDHPLAAIRAEPKRPDAIRQLIADRQLVFGVDRNLEVLVGVRELVKKSVRHRNLISSPGLEVAGYLLEAKSSHEIALQVMTAYPPEAEKS